MSEEELNNIVDRLAEEYEFKKSTIRRYYRLFKKYPMFCDEDAEVCLELLCQSRNEAEATYRAYLAKCKTKSEADSEISYNVDSLTSSMAKILLEVYPDYYYTEDKDFIKSIIYDENEYDIMERDEYVEDVRDVYIKEKHDILQKIFEEEMNKMQLTKHK